MILITSPENLNTLKSHDLIQLECELCHTLFQKQKKDVMKAIRGNPRTKCNYCSIKCRQQSRGCSIEVKCKLCQCSFTIKPSSVLENGNFCSSSCAATYNNRVRNGYDPLAKNLCPFCGLQIGMRRKFCSALCQKKNSKQSLIDGWLSGEINGSAGLGKINKTIRQYLIEQSNYKCSLCGWGQLHPLTGTTPLQIDHIDGNWRDNSKDNLRVLCPNCHSLTLTFGGRNRGNGRHIALKIKGYSTR